jgi:hypothetical protein
MHPPTEEDNVLGMAARPPRRWPLDGSVAENCIAIEREAARCRSRNPSGQVDRTASVIEPDSVTKQGLPEPRGALSSVTPRLDLATYRSAVGDVVLESGRAWESAGPARVERVLAEALGRRELVTILSEVAGGVDTVAERLLGEVHQYRPSERSSARDLPSLVRIFLLSQIDSAWWGREPPFVSDGDVRESSQLVDLDGLRPTGLLRFQYLRQPTGLPGRGRDWAMRRVFPGRRPNTAGLRFPWARPEAIAVLNKLARELAAATAPVELPPLWVTSLVRSVEHQHHLRDLGYAAVLPSSHCVGYGMDVEMRWFSRFDEKQALPSILLEHQDLGELNVIDEGQAWHICINPSTRAELAAAYHAEVGQRVAVRGS